MKGRSNQLKLSQPQHCLRRFLRMELYTSMVPELCKRSLWHGALIRKRGLGLVKNLSISQSTCQ